MTENGIGSRPAFSHAAAILARRSAICSSVGMTVLYSSA
jgi:hypothetical protein